MSDPPNSVQYLVELGYEDPVQLQRQRQVRESLLDAQLADARRLLTARQFDLCRKLLDQLVLDAPQWTAPRRLAAHLDFQCGRWELCQQHLDWLEHNGMEQAELSLLRARLAIAKRQWEKAIDEAEYAAFLGCDPSTAAMVVGEVCLRCGHLEQAEQAFARAGSRPDHAAQGLAGRAGVALRMSDWEAAVELSLDALQYGFDAPSVHFRLGVALLKIGHLAEAEAAFLAVARLQPNAAGPFRYLSAIARLQGDVAKAERLMAEGRNKVKQRRMERK